MDSVIDELSIIIDMIRKKENLKAIEKRGVRLITQLEANNYKNEEKEDEKLTTNFLAIQKKNEILQKQITDADVTINDLQKQIDDLKLEKQELKHVNLSLLDDKQNLEKIMVKKEKKITVEKSTGTDLLILTKTKEQELKDKIKELEKDIIMFDEKINEYDRYFNEKIFHFDYPPLKRYVSLDDEIQYIQLDEKKKNNYCCCFM